jgi:transposase
MMDTELLQLGLSLAPPWVVEECRLDVKEKRLDITVNFDRGGSFECPTCGRKGCKAYDTELKTWRHLNFFEHLTYLHGWTPRVQCPGCGVKTASVPWARPGSRFTLLFEAMILVMAKQMPVKAVAGIVGEHDTRIWRVVMHHVEEARARENFRAVRRIGVDETSRRRGHRYITVFMDLDRGKLIYATKGKDAETVKSFAEDLKVHNGKPKNIRHVSSDMSKAFIAGVEAYLPNAQITFDKFHAVQLMNEAVEEVRREEQKERIELKKSRYLWLKNPENLDGKEEARLAPLVSQSNLKTARAYRVKLAFQQLYEQPSTKAEEYLKRWYFWATHSRIPQVIAAARTVKQHWGGILRWFETRITNGLLEGTISLIQAAKAKARGYRTPEYLITIAYLIAGQLTFSLPT